MIPFYRAFEDKHRGSRDVIKQRLRVYFPFLENLKALYENYPALDIGCGRGEWLEILQEEGFQAVGIDLDEGMLEACWARDLQAEKAEALSYLAAMPSNSLVLLTGFHIVEHIPFDDLKDLVKEAYRVLMPGGLLIFETPNAENLIVGTQNFYLDPTHERPIPYMLLEFLMEYSGFARTKLLRLQESAALDHQKQVVLMDVLGGVSPDYAVVAQKHAVEIDLSGFDLSFESEYGISLSALAERYDSVLLSRYEELKTCLEKREADGIIFSDHLEALATKEGIYSNRVETLENREELLSERLSVLESRESSSVFEKLEQQIERSISLQQLLNESLSNAHKWCVEAESRLQRLQASNEALQNAEHKLFSVLAEHQSAILQLAQIKKSTSWRITTPLRLVSSRAKVVIASPKQITKRVIRGTVKLATKIIHKMPFLREKIKLVLKKYPSLNARLKMLSVRYASANHPANQRPSTSVYGFEKETGFNNGPTTSDHVVAPEHLTENAKKLFIKLNSTSRTRDFE